MQCQTIYIHFQLYLENHWNHWIIIGIMGSPATLQELFELLLQDETKPLQDSHTKIFSKNGTQTMHFSLMHFINCFFFGGPMTQVDNDS